MRVFRWAKGLFVPEWDNKLQNTMLYMAHEHGLQQEIAKQDFMANTLVLTTAVGSEDAIRKKLKMLTDLSSDFRSIIRGDYLDPAHREKRAQQKAAEERKDLDLLKKAEQLGSMDSFKWQTEN